MNFNSIDSAPKDKRIVVAALRGGGHGFDASDAIWDKPSWAQEGKWFKYAHRGSYQGIGFDPTHWCEFDA